MLRFLLAGFEKNQVWLNYDALIINYSTGKLDMKYVHQLKG